MAKKFGDVLERKTGRKGGRTGKWNADCVETSRKGEKRGKGRCYRRFGGTENCRTMNNAQGARDEHVGTVAEMVGRMGKGSF